MSKAKTLPPRNELFSLLRFAFSISIVAFHFGPAGLKVWLRGLTSGTCLVTFFFVVAGFFAIQSYERFQGSRTDFLVGKFKRLAPYYYLSTALCIVFDLVNQRFPWMTFLNNLCITQSVFPDTDFAFNGPSWFVSAIIVHFALFILVAPWILKARKSTLVAIAILLWIVTVFVQSYFCKIENYDISANSYITPWTHIAAFFAGIAGARVFEHGQSSRLSSGYLMIGILLLTFVELHFRFVELLPFPVVESNGLYVPLFTALTLITASQTISVTNRFDNRWCRLAGAISYPVYILQVPLNIIWNRIIRWLAPNASDLTVLVSLILFSVVCCVGLVEIASLKNRMRFSIKEKL